MPTPLQNRVLLGLELGNKLHEVLREVHMPSKAMVDEWCTNPEFAALYDAAAEKGRQVREKKVNRATSQPITAQKMPAVLRGQFTERLTTELSLTVQPDPMPNPIELQQVVLDRLRAGHAYRDIVKEVDGFSPVVLGQWRKDPAFAAKYDEARQAGQKPAERISEAQRKAEIASILAATEAQTKPPPTPDPEEGEVWFVVMGAEPRPDGMPETMDTEEEALRWAAIRANLTKQPAYVLKPLWEIEPKVKPVR